MPVLVAVPAPSSAMVIGREPMASRMPRSVGREDGALGAGEVVLGEGGDLLEELGPRLVVEEPGGVRFGAGWRGPAGLRLGDGLEWWRELLLRAPAVP